MLLSAWLLFMAAVQVVAFVAIYRFFVLTPTGQNLDTYALESNRLVTDHLAGVVNNVLDAISIVAAVLATCIIGFIALIRRRFALAVTSVVLVAGVNLSAELLKHYLNRPNLGIDEARAGAGNSFPSGHTAIAASVVVALVLVLPPAARSVGAIIASLYAALVGVATMSAGWHRPSDAVAAILIVGVWAALAGILLRVLRRRGERVSDDESHKVAVIVLAAIGAVALVAAIVGLRLTYQVIGTDPDTLSTRREFAAYGGSAAGILATASLVLAAILLTVHRVVPSRGSAGPRAKRVARSIGPTGADAGVDTTKAKLTPSSGEQSTIARARSAAKSARTAATAVARNAKTATKPSRTAGSRTERSRTTREP
jgi:membrane-associated phospholipid phosphatase